MSNNKQKLKTVVIALMIGGILCMHYFTPENLLYYHAVYRMLFYLPLVFGSLWFGLRGAVYVCGAVSLFFLPHVMEQWEGFSLEEFHRILEGALYIIISLILGFLVEREKRKQRALLRSERLAVVGKAVSEIAHDMKTPLMAIGGFARQVSKDLTQDDPNQKKLDIVITETARLETMVKEMLDFGKPIQLQLMEIDLKDLVLDSIRVLQPLAKKARVELKADLATSLPILALDPSRIRQALLNLVTNAIQASPEGEEVWVRTLLGGQNVILEVVDCGCGINQEDIENVFNPFFSTKKGGTGLGLGIVKRIVEAHGGEVYFQVNPENGVTFRVGFPLKPQKKSKNW